VVFLGFVGKNSPLKIEMVDFWTFRLKTTSKQVASVYEENPIPSILMSILRFSFIFFSKRTAAAKEEPISWSI